MEPYRPRNNLTAHDLYLRAFALASSHFNTLWAQGEAPNPSGEVGRRQDEREPSPSGCLLYLLERNAPCRAWGILHVASYGAKDAIYQHSSRGLRDLGYARDRYLPRGGLAYTTGGARLDGRWVAVGEQCEGALEIVINHTLALTFA